MTQRISSLPIWTWEHLEEALQTLSQGPSSDLMLAHHLAGLKADRPALSDPELLTEILSLAVLVAATMPGHVVVPRGFDPLLEPSQGEC